ncbi:uncharacterized protein LOC118776502 [Megalops cyprinoides]|uniref:uncharacterized protein LOC118776502 n=1 Tax=Megalops cyprinoides TaxID=118141 RepID=UPI001864BB8C|nr:uncharacterized protein LOC118776502 [Megalops cyprinoides]
MFRVLCVTAMLCCILQGEAFILHHSEKKLASLPPATVSDIPVIKMNRCQGELLKDIRQMLLKALNLEKEPQVSGVELSRIREQWKAAFKATNNSTTEIQEVTGVSTTSTPENPGNNEWTNKTDMHCCQLVSKIFIKDLGWQNWIIYPESFIYTHCAPCSSRMDSISQICRAHSSPSKMECCRSVSQELVPFLYVDRFETLVISSVYLPKQCGCKPGTNPHHV